MTNTGTAIQQGDARARDVATSMLQQGKTASEVWEALVSSGVDGADAEAIVREVFKQLPTQVSYDEFCRECHDQSLDSPSGSVSTIRGTGTMFYGNAEACPTCGSTIRIHWVTFFYMPLIPLDAYRCLRIGGTSLTAQGMESQFISRHTKMRWEQVFTHWLVLLLIVVGPWLIVGLSARR